MKGTKLICNILFFLIILLSSTLAQRPQQNKVRLSGTYVNGGEGDFLFDISAYGSLMLSDMIAQFFVDDENHFSVTFELKKPTYCRLGRNILYLSPGDSLRVYIDRDAPDAARFAGIGEEANNYLKETPFPHSGSYLKSGANIKGSFTDTWNYILSESDKREQQLQKLTSVSKTFKRLELGRIRADKINSLKLFKIYLGDLDTVTAMRIKHELKNVEDSILKNLTSGFWNDDLLSLEVYRVILSQFKDEAGQGESNVLGSDWLLANRITRRLAAERDKDNYEKLRPEIQKIRHENFRQIVADNYAANLHRFDKFTAPEFPARDRSGKEVSMLKYRGKVIYIDVGPPGAGPASGKYLLSNY